MSREDLESLADAFRRIDVDPAWPREGQFAARRYNAASEAERALLEATLQAGGAADALEVALRGAAALYRAERERVLVRFNLRERRSPALRGAPSRAA
jgi:hypothetical protein